MIVSETHLAIMLAGLAAGETVCEVASGSEAATLLGVVEALGARIRGDHDGRVAITGVGNGCLLQPEGPLPLDKPDQALLVAGLVAPYDMPMRVECTGGFSADELDTLVAAFGAMGIQAEADGRHAIAFAGQATSNPAIHDAGKWSNPVIAAIVLAALGTPGITRIGGLSRDPVELVQLFVRFAAAVDVAATNGRWSLAITGQTDIRAPADARAHEDSA